MGAGRTWTWRVFFQAVVGLLVAGFLVFYTGRGLGPALRSRAARTWAIWGRAPERNDHHHTFSSSLLGNRAPRRKQLAKQGTAEHKKRVDVSADSLPLFNRKAAARAQQKRISTKHEHDVQGDLPNTKQKVHVKQTAAPAIRARLLGKTPVRKLDRKDVAVPTIRPKHHGNRLKHHGKTPVRKLDHKDVGQRRVDADGVRNPMPPVGRHATIPPHSAVGYQANKGRQRKYIPKPVADAVRQLILFVGYPRSCHSLVGSQLDAHPNMVVAHEYNLIGRWAQLERRYRTRYDIFNQLYEYDKQQALGGHNSVLPGMPSTMAPKGYSYGVPCEWQGNYNGTISILGDKHGGRTAKLLDGIGHPGINVGTLEDMAATLDIPLVFVHVMRHPLDNVATMAMWQDKHRSVVNGTARQVHGEKFDNRHRLRNMATVYSQLTDAVAKVKARFKTIDVRCEDMVADPVEALRSLCARLGMPCSQEYLEHCASIVQGERSRTRDFVKWPPDIVEELAANVSKHSFITDNYNIHGVL